MRRDIEASDLGRHGSTLRDIAEDLDAAQNKLEELESEVADLRDERDRLAARVDRLGDEFAELRGLS